MNQPDELSQGLDWLGLTGWVLAAMALPPWVMITAALVTLTRGAPEERLVEVDGEAFVVLVEPGLSVLAAGALAAVLLLLLAVVGGGVAALLRRWDQPRRRVSEVVALDAPVRVAVVHHAAEAVAEPVSAAPDAPVTRDPAPPGPDQAPVGPSERQADLAPRGAVDRFIGGDDGVP